MKGRRRERIDGKDSSDKNPLSSARKGNGSSSSSINNNGNGSRRKDGDNGNGNGNVGGGGRNSNDDGGSRADRDARSLWHRKSGIGHRLFLSYYGMQPPGVVVECCDINYDTKTTEGNDDDADADGNGMMSANDGIVRCSGGGMSRAAKRRRRQREKGSAATAGQHAAVPFHEKRSREANEICHASSVIGGSVAIIDATARRRRANDRTMDDASRHSLHMAYVASNGRYAHLSHFVDALSRPLPLTFRFRECVTTTPSSSISSSTSSSSSSSSSSFSAADDMKRRLREEYTDLVMPAHFDQSTNIYQSTPNSSLCRYNLGALSPKLRELIVEGSTSGILARQELGSMLPVIGLRGVGALGAGSRVLDLCASPGSKTLQTLEIVAADGDDLDECDRGISDRRRGRGGGRVIANDVHPGRLDSLREAVSRSGMSSSVTARVTYTNYDASSFPSPKSGRLFDAVICDVPCGGDGTIRKDVHVLPMWSPNISNSMHVLQLRILQRALQLVKVGGVVCYSTCSMNPIENEAVVAAALRGRTGFVGVGGAMYELLEWPSGSLPGFVLRPGARDWKVAFYDHDGGAWKNDEDADDNDDDGFDGLTFFDDYVSASAAGVVGDISPSFWPNPAENGNLGLHRCVRLLPQDQDSGGFFLGLIKRCC